MKINVNDKEKLQKALDEVQAKSRTRTITVENMQAAVKHYEAYLAKLMPKKYWQGIGLLFDHNAQNFPNAYKGNPMGTRVRIIRGSSDWFITEIERSKVATEGNAYTMLCLTEEKERAIVNHVTHPFSIGNRRGIV